MKNKLFTLAAALTLAAVVGSFYAAPALAAAIKAVLVKNIDEKGRSPYTAPALCALSANTCTAVAIGPAVPTGQRLIIEHASGTFSVPAGSIISELSVSQGTFRRAALRPVLLSTEGGVDKYIVNDQVLVYLDAAEFPSVILSTPFGGTSVAVNIVLTGYFVDLNN